MLSRRSLALVALPLLAGLSACGRPSRLSANPEFATRQPLPSVEATVFPSPTTPPEQPAESQPPATAVPTGSPSGPSASGNVIAGDDNNKFIPAQATLKLKAGKVTFVAHSVGAAPHTWQSDELKFDSGNVAGGQKKTITFAAKPGTYDYYCLYHKSLGMVGKMIIQ